MPAGYLECGGCGRLFKERNPVEVRVFQEHDCNDKDWELPYEKVVLDMKKEMGNNGS